MATPDPNVHPRGTGVHEYGAHCPPFFAFSREHHPGDFESALQSGVLSLCHGKTPKMGDRIRDCAIFCDCQFQTTAMTGNNGPEGSQPTATFCYHFPDPCKAGKGQFGPM